MGLDFVKVQAKGVYFAAFVAGVLRPAFVARIYFPPTP